MASIGRRAYAEIFGPTVGDRLRLADTDLVVEVEADYTLRAGSSARKSSSAAARRFATAWLSRSEPMPKAPWTR